MSDMEPAKAPRNVVAANDAPPAPKPAHASKIPPSFAAELLHRRDELGWTLRGLSEWVSGELKEPVSHRAVDRFLQSLQKKALLEAQRPLQALLTEELTRITESLSEERRILDDTEEDIARARLKAPEQVKELDADHARSLRKIRSLVAQFNAYGKHVPKPDSRVVPVCTPDSDRFTESAPAEPNPVAAPPPAPPEGPAPVEPVPLVPVCTPTPEGYTTPENANWLSRLLPQAHAVGGRRTMSFGEWIASQPEALLGRPIELEPSWKNHPSDVIFIDISRHETSAEMAKTLAKFKPEEDHRIVFVLPRDLSPEALKKMPPSLNPPLVLPLTKQKVNAALKSVATAKRRQEPPRRTG